MAYNGIILYMTRDVKETILLSQEAVVILAECLNLNPKYEANIWLTALSALSARVAKDMGLSAEEYYMSTISCAETYRDDWGVL